VIRVLTIGPFDSSGATGVPADLRVFQDLGASGVSALTEVMAAADGEARRRFRLPPRTVEAQLDAVTRPGVDAAKIAGLYDRTLVDTLAERVRRRRLGPVLLDPGIVDARGARVLGRSGVEWLRKRLLPRVAVVVLRSAELAILAGIAIEETDTAVVAIEQIRQFGSAAVLAEASAPGGSGLWLGDETGIRPLAAAIPAGVGERDRFTAALTVHLARGSALEVACQAAWLFAAREDDARLGQATAPRP